MVVKLNNLKANVMNNITEEFMTEVKEYLRLRKEHLEIVATIKVTKVITQAILLITGIVALMSMATFFIISAVLLIKPYVGEILAFFFGGILYICFWFIVYLLRNIIIINPIAKFVNSIIKV